MAPAARRAHCDDLHMGIDSAFTVHFVKKRVISMVIPIACFNAPLAVRQFTLLVQGLTKLTSFVTALFFSLMFCKCGAFRFELCKV